MVWNINIRVFFSIIGLFVLLQLVVVGGFLYASNHFYNQWVENCREYQQVTGKINKAQQQIISRTRLARQYAVTGKQQYLDDYRALVTDELFFQLFESFSFSDSEQAWLNNSANLAKQLVEIETTVFDMVPTSLSPAVVQLFTGDYYQAQDSIARQLSALTTSIENRYQSKNTSLQMMLDKLNFYIIVALVVFITITVLILITMHKKILRPISYLTQTIETMWRGEKLEKRVFYKDEIGFLARQFYSMKDYMDENYRDLEIMSFQDALTGLYNRRYFFQAAEQSLQTAKRNKQQICLLMTDLDYFKSVNDIHGHLVGDEVLRHVSSIIAGTVRESDICARFGGEEFIVLLQNTVASGAVTIAEKIRANIENSPYVSGDLTLNLTISIGVSQIGNEKGGINMTLDNADKALYQAKNSGRNRVCLI
ncbi:GGDEF domain-containing protein [Candidatus Persebacteraceae bacterium Df01]|jgi:diguanylate cyclase (GGDEF)-like protein|uniref:diguanylate cyclase n=1 Tax=Candidatus Doriopsillibacter californiensis TaxID=2970740 RepID=A0ABT7QMI3_9GAMM|nr:GGDEF domain-containing protein [Candidatus Persebacteraceae bacterium Df01]